MEDDQDSGMQDRKRKMLLKTICEWKQDSFFRKKKYLHNVGQKWLCETNKKTRRLLLVNKDKEIIIEILVFRL